MSWSKITRRWRDSGANKGAVLLDRVTCDPDIDAHVLTGYSNWLMLLSCFMLLTVTVLQFLGNGSVYAAKV